MASSSWLTSPPVGLVVDVHPDTHRSAVVGEDLAVKQHRDQPAGIAPRTAAPAVLTDAQAAKRVVTAGDADAPVADARTWREERIPPRGVATVAVPLGVTLQRSATDGPTVPSGMRVRPWTRWRPAADGAATRGSECRVARSSQRAGTRGEGP